jgi:hypothetical protein
VKQIIIGSTAAQKYSLSRRTPSDLDIWCEGEIPKEKGVDVKIIQRQLSPNRSSNMLIAIIYDKVVAI